MAVQGPTLFDFDNTSDTTFRTWAKRISDWFATIGWIQTNDTGQAVLSQTTFDVDDVLDSGANGIYTYSNLVGPVLRIGMSVVIAGSTNAGNNGTYTITALGSGNFTVVNAGAVTENPSPGTGSTTLTARPGNNSYVYEIWRPGDSGTTYYIKAEYGTGNNSSLVSTRWSAGTTTTGAGVLSGITISTQFAPARAAGGTQALNALEFASGDTSRFTYHVAAGNGQSDYCINIERYHDADGDDNNVGFVLYVIGDTASNSADCVRALTFGEAAYGSSSTRMSFLTRTVNSSQSGNLKIAVSPAYPYASGIFKFPSKGLVLYESTDLPIRLKFKAFLYGVEMTWLAAAHRLSLDHGSGQFYGMRFE